MTFSKVHCLFEQSGTFKKAFKELGYNAIDYDINKTENVDIVVDLFIQIFFANEEKRYSVFDNISQDDLVIAFFPCTYFSDQSQLLSRIENNKGFARSVISTTFAKNFIKTYITND